MNINEVRLGFPVTILAGNLGEVDWDIKATVLEHFLGGQYVLILPSGPMTPLPLVVPGTTQVEVS